MALQDLTPQLRTRLSRLERLVGWFVGLAILLLIFGLGYYVYQLSARKGWFLKKMPYFTFVRNAAGLKPGDRVMLMGFDAGQILEITPMKPEDQYFNVYVRFRINEPYYGYLWDDSRARIGAADFLGHRFIEVTKGTNGIPTYAMRKIVEPGTPAALGLVGGTNNYVFAEEVDLPGTTNLLIHFGEALSREKLQELARQGVQTVMLLDNNSPVPRPPRWVWNEKQGKYEPIPEHFKGYWLRADESPALTERLETVVNTVEAALPDFLALTNKLSRVLTKADNIATHVDELLVSVRPVLSNVTEITSNLKNPKGSLGEWILPTNINLQLQGTLGQATSTLAKAQADLNTISSNLVVSLQNLATVTSNLSVQVQSSPWVLPQISDLVVYTDEMIQGLKRFWLFRSTFQGSSNAPPESIVRPRLGGEK